MCAQTPVDLADRSAEDVDPVPLGEADDGALGVGPLPPAEPGAAPLAGPVERVDARHPDAEDGLDRLPDLGPVGAGGHHEGVLAVVGQPVALLRDHRPQQDIPRIRDLAHCCSSSGCLTGFALAGARLGGASSAPAAFASALPGASSVPAFLAGASLAGAALAAGLPLAGASSVPAALTSASSA